MKNPMRLLMSQYPRTRQLDWIALRPARRRSIEKPGTVDVNAAGLVAEWEDVAS